MNVPDMPPLAGIHHLKLPVTDLARSLEWYRSRLGYQVQPATYGSVFRSPDSVRQAFRASSG